MGLEGCPIDAAGKLTASIGVDDHRASRLALSNGHLQGGDDQLGIQDLAHRPADDSTAVEV
jgi:hypothetical protein